MSDPTEYSEEDEYPDFSEDEDDTGVSEGDEGDGIPDGSGYDDLIDDDDDDDDEEEDDPSDPEEKEPDKKPEEENQEQKTYKIKVRGEEMEVTQDELKEVFGLKETPMTEELAGVLVDARQKQLAGMQALTESGKYRKQVNQFFEELRKDPMAVLLDPQLGINFDELAEQRVIEKVQYELMKPEERALYDQKKQIEKDKAEVERFRQEQQAQQYEKETNHYFESYGNQAVSALKETGLPETEYVFQRIVAHMSGQYRQTGADPDARSAAQSVKREIEELISHLGKSMTPDQIAQVFGTEGTKKMRQYEIAKVKKNRIPKQAEPGKGQAGKPQRKQDKYLNEQSLRELLDRRYGPL